MASLGAIISSVSNVPGLALGLVPGSARACVAPTPRRRVSRRRACRARARRFEARRANAPGTGWRRASMEVGHGGAHGGRQRSLDGREAFLLVGARRLSSSARGDEFALELVDAGHGVVEFVERGAGAGPPPREPRGPCPGRNGREGTRDGREPRWGGRSCRRRCFRRPLDAGSGGNRRGRAWGWTRGGRGTRRGPPSRARRGRCAPRRWRTRCQPRRRRGWARRARGGGGRVPDGGGVARREGGRGGAIGRRRVLARRRVAVRRDRGEVAARTGAAPEGTARELARVRHRARRRRLDAVQHRARALGHRRHRRHVRRRARSVCLANTREGTSRARASWPHVKSSAEVVVATVVTHTERR